MRVAVVGSRDLHVDDASLAAMLPRACTQIVSGGARGIDRCAAAYARAHGLTLVELAPDWERYGRRAGVLRNLAIVDAADEVLALWDGASAGTKHTIDFARRARKPIHVYRWTADGFVTL